MMRSPSRAGSRLGLRVRALWPDEGDVVDAVFGGMSARSRYLRFHSPVRQLSDRFRRGLLDVDGQSRVALVAEVAGPHGWRPVGIARLARTAPDQTEAEISIAVVDDMHRRGVGRQLLEALGERAAQLDVTTIHADVLRQNQAARDLIGSVFALSAAYLDGEVVRLTCSVAPAAPDRITPYDLFADLYR